MIILTIYNIIVLLSYKSNSHIGICAEVYLRLANACGKTCTGTLISAVQCSGI